MSITLPWWGWLIAAAAILLSLAFAYACGYANGDENGIDRMKRDAIRAGVAKSCDFDGGWRWWTPDEIVARRTRRGEV